MAVLLAAALIIHTVEAQLPPPVPVAGVRLGLANVITLAALVLIGRREAGALLIMRIILGGIISGNFVGMIYSFCGGVMCFAVEALIIGFFDDGQIWLVSIIGAIAHNVGQIGAAVIITSTPQIAWYLAILIVTGIISGLITGLAAMYVIIHIKKIMKRMNINGDENDS